MDRASQSTVRVLRVITRLNIGGPSIQAIALSDRLSARGFETELVYGRLGAGEGDMRYLFAPGLRTRYLSSLRRPVAPLHDPVALARLIDIMRDVRPHIVHTHMAKAGTVGRLAAAAYNATVGRGNRARIVHTYHGHVLEGYFDSRTAKFFTAAERQLAKFSDAIVAISPQIRDELLTDFRIGRADQYRVIPLGFDLTALAAIDGAARHHARVTLDVPAEAHVVSTVGRLTAIKQHDLFLEAAALVAQRDPQALFLIVGDGDLRGDLERTAARLGLTPRVRFLGWRRDLATVYGATDVFMLTSRNEGTPVALIESLAAGVPGVSTDVGGVGDVIDDIHEGAIGLLAPSGDARTLADHTLSLLANPDERRRMGESGRRSVTARYTLHRLVANVERLYRELLH
jgi:glycosyltransferase involved in cell wall biosynthesis